MNRAVLAVFSTLFANTIHEDVDLVVVPEMEVQTFLDLLHLHSKVNKGSEVDLTGLPQYMVDLISLLDCRLLLPRHQFKLNQPPRDVSRDRPRVGEADPFLPGYSANSAVSIESLEKKEERRIEEESCIENKAELEELDNKCTASIRRRGRGRPPKDRSGESEVFAEVEIKEDLSPADPTLDHIVSGFLSCHSCHEGEFSLRSQLMIHFNQVHCWNHPLDHCVYCDTPFMAKSVCSKHEKEGV